MKTNQTDQTQMDYVATGNVNIRNDDSGATISLYTHDGTAYHVKPGSHGLAGRWVVNVQQWDEEFGSYQHYHRCGDYPSLKAALESIVGVQ